MSRTGILALFIAQALCTSACLTGADTETGGTSIHGSGDICARRGWYGDSECDTFCQRRDPDCATDLREPELSDPSVVLTSAITMGEALDQLGPDNPAIEAKFEPDGDGNLSLSVYPLGKSIREDAEHNVFVEVAGVVPLVDQEETSWSPAEPSAFTDQEHLTRSARDLTLVQLSRVTERDAVAAAEDVGTVYWAIPTIEERRAGYGVYVLDGGRSQYYFVDGQGPQRSEVHELRRGPGAVCTATTVTGCATDPRLPELGQDLGVLRQTLRRVAAGEATILRMSDALLAMEQAHGPAIEAKYEEADGGISLSIYPVGPAIDGVAGIDVDAQRNRFFELAGDPTATTYDPTPEEFTVDGDEGVEHLQRSARDLTIVQTASLTLLSAVKKVERRFRGGFVFWAIPTIRSLRAGYGIWVLASDGTAHYLFVS